MPSKLPPIYLCGNPLLPADAVPFLLESELCARFPALAFVSVDPNENLKPQNGILALIDTAAGIDRVQALCDTAAFAIEPRYSAHDLDLAFMLRLFYKLGELRDLTVFAIPLGMDKDEAFKQLAPLIEKWQEEKGRD